MPLFQSKFKMFRQNLWSTPDEYHPTLGVRVKDGRQFVAEFGVHRGDFEIETPDGVERYADIAGYFFDLDEYAEREGMTSEQKKQALMILRREAAEHPQFLWEVEPQVVGPPWPTYDSVAYGKVADLAAELGLVAEALAYEQASKARPSVIEGLKAKLEEAETVEELTAAS